MLKLLASLLKRIRRNRRGPAIAKDENAAIYESLAMTEELREALFPKRQQMVSAIFERSQAPLIRPPIPTALPQVADRDLFF